MKASSPPTGRDRRVLIVEFTGYNRHTVCEWIRFGKLRALALQHKYMIPKCYLIDWLSTDEHNATPVSPAAMLTGSGSCRNGVTDNEGKYHRGVVLRQYRPAGSRLQPESPVKKASDSLNDLEEKLTEQLAGENKALFLRFCNAYAEFMGECELDTFITGFRLGARFMMDTFLSDDALLESFLDM